MSEAERPDVPESVTHLWDCVRQALHACGEPSPLDIDRLAASCGLKLPSSTVEGWFRTWAVVPAWEKFDALVKALGAEQDQDWKSLHGAALTADRQRKAKVRRRGAGRFRASASHGDESIVRTDPVDRETARPDRADPVSSHEQARVLPVRVVVTRVPHLRATVTYIPDRKSVIFLSLGVLAMTAVLSILLSSFSPGTHDRGNRAAFEPPASSVPPPPGDPTRLPPWPLPDRRQLRAPPQAPAGAPTVLYVGDLLAQQSGTMVANFLHRDGTARLVTAAHPSTALCDYLADRPQASAVPAEHKLTALIRTFKPRVVVLQFWGRTVRPTPCTEGSRPGSDDYYRRYQADARQVARQADRAAREAGIPRPKLTWVLQGPGRKEPERIRRLNEEIFRAAAARHGDLVSDAGLYVSQAADPDHRDPDARYAWTSHLPCSAVERRHGYCPSHRFGGMAQLHPRHDGVLFCLSPKAKAAGPCETPSPGIARYGKAIAHTVLTYLKDLPR